MSNSLRVSALLAVCLCLALPSFAAQGIERAPRITAVNETPTVQSITEAEVPDKILNLEGMPVLLDGVELPDGLQTKGIPGGLYLAVDEEQGVINAFGSREELEKHLGETGKLGCNTSNKTPTQCIFFNVPNCGAPPLPPPPPAPAAVAINCGNAVANIVTLLGGPIKSFEIGCGTTFLFPNNTCTGTGVAISGTTGCFNVSVPNPFNCVGCIL